MAIDLRDIQYRPLVESCPRGAFRCGEPDLDKWFLKHACKRHDSHDCRVTTVHVGEEATPIGFYAMGIVLEEERLLNGDGPLRRRVFKRVYPALHLEFLAVTQEAQGQQVGTDMMIRIIETFRRSVLDLGVPVLTLRPLNDELQRFYGSLGFHPYAAHIGERRMMLPAATVIDMFNRAETASAPEADTKNGGT